MRKTRFLALLALLALLAGCAQAESADWFHPHDEAAGYTYVAFGRYPYEEDGSEKPILWRALREDGGGVYLLSEYLIEVSRLHSVAFGYPGWEEADLNGWLNRAFIAAAFSDAEAAALVEMPGLGRVSLPSSDDIKDKGLGFGTDESRRATGTPWADSRGLFFYRHKGHSPYWTRTPASRDFAHLTTKLEGNIGYLGVTAEDLGVRPVITLALGKVRVAGGSGSMADPYTLSPLSEATPDPTAAARATLLPALPVPGTEGLSEGIPEDGLAAANPATGWAKTGDLRREGFPALTPEGFLPEGEEAFVHIDEAGGVWRYADQALRVMIDKTRDEEMQSNILIAEIYLKEGAPGFRMVHHDPENRTVNRDAFKEKPANIAKNNQLVFSMDGDYYLYRVSMAKNRTGYPIGVIIRDGDILFDKPPREGREAYPPLDMLALFENGDMQVFRANEKTAEEMVALGARDVLAFGPYLIRDGEMNAFHERLGNTNQPRAGIGMVQPGHYFAVIVEGRIKGSLGVPTRRVGQMFMDLGCATAFNLDGGWTSAMVFMGKQLNQLDKSGVRDNARIQNEVMGIGYNENVK
ncbi:MAG: phosphodiester glycosidase family protein [Clostridiales bacterium]|nr:phosphodiester glycosidase family protein [Clostridiales bacterium]